MVTISNLDFVECTHDVNRVHMNPIIFVVRSIRLLCSHQAIGATVGHDMRPISKASWSWLTSTIELGAFHLLMSHS